MPRPKSLKPGYTLHKPSGRAYVRIDGRCVYLGPYGTQASRDEYDRVIGEWIAHGRQSAPRAPSPAVGTDGASAVSGVTIAEVVNAFRKHATTYYRHADGTPTSEVDNLRQALRPLVRLYGRTPAAAFNPLNLEALKEEMIRLGWARTHINRQLPRVKSLFKWAVSKAMVPSGVYEALRTVPGLRKGRSEARDSEPVVPVQDGIVEAVLPFLSRQVAAMVQLQRLTGARPGELWIMRPCDLDTRNATLWEYRPAQHKTAHHGHERVIPLGPKAQAVIAQFLAPGRPTTSYLFSPAEAEAERRAKLHEARKTPLSCGNRPGTNRRAKPRTMPGDRYDKDSYRQAIVRACDKAFPPPPELMAGPEVESAEAAQARLDALDRWRAEHRFHPHQIRHTVGTDLRQRFGVEAAQVILGHKELKVTQLYAEKNVEAARRIMSEVG